MVVSLLRFSTPYFTLDTIIVERKNVFSFRKTENDSSQLSVVIETNKTILINFTKLGKSVSCSGLLKKTKKTNLLCLSNSLNGDFDS